MAPSTSSGLGGNGVLRVATATLRIAASSGCPGGGRPLHLQLPFHGNHCDLPQSGYQLLGQRPFRQVFEESREPARRGRGDHTSKCEGLAADVGCIYTCDCGATGEPQSILSNSEIHLAERVLPEHDLLPEEAVVGTDLVQAGQPRLRLLLLPPQ